jgi:hypothetical protein
MTLCWQTSRSRFNHDWLKNRFLPSISKFLNILDEKVEDPEFESCFLKRVLPEWQFRLSEGFVLASSFDSQMSPRLLFGEPPLTCVPAATRRWLEPIVHELWKNRCSADQLCDRLTRNLCEADNAYRSLVFQLNRQGERPSPEYLLGLRQQCDEFRTHCEAVAESLEPFPRGIEVT